MAGGQGWQGMGETAHLPSYAGEVMAEHATVDGYSHGSSESNGTAALVACLFANPFTIVELNRVIVSSI